MDAVNLYDILIRSSLLNNLRVEMAWDVAKEGEADVDNEISGAATDHEDAHRRAWQIH